MYASTENASKSPQGWKTQRLNRGGQICISKKKHNLLNDIQIRSAVARYSSGSYTVKEFLCSVSHCCDNVTCPLSQRDDTGSSTELKNMTWTMSMTIYNHPSAALQHQQPLL